MAGSPIRKARREAAERERLRQEAIARGEIQDTPLVPEITPAEAVAAPVKIKEEKRSPAGPAERLSAAMMKEVDLQPVEAPPPPPMLAETQAGEFQELLTESVKRARELMALRPEVEDPTYPKILNMQANVLATVMSTATKIDENNLRRQSADKIDDLLALARRKAVELTTQPAAQARDRQFAHRGKPLPPDV